MQGLQVLKDVAILRFALLPRLWAAVAEATGGGGVLPAVCCAVLVQLARAKPFLRRRAPVGSCGAGGRPRW